MFNRNKMETLEKIRVLTIDTLREMIENEKDVITRDKLFKEVKRDKIQIGERLIGVDRVVGQTELLKVVNGVIGNKKYYEGYIKGSTIGGSCALYRNQKVLEEEKKRWVTKVRLRLTILVVCCIAWLAMIWYM